MAELAKLLDVALSSYREEHRDLSEVWSSLDTKAQGTGAFAGIFLAACFAWTRELPAIQLWQQWSLVAAVILLVVSVVLAIFAMQVRAVSLPPLGDELRDLVDDLMKNSAPDEVPARLEAFTKDQLALWQETNKEVMDVLGRKADFVTWAQRTLLTAGLPVALVTIAKLLG